MTSRHASKNSKMDSNSSIACPGGETTRQQNIRLSNDSSSASLGCIKLVVLASSMLYLLTPSTLPSCFVVIWFVISVRLRLLPDLDRFDRRSPAASPTRFRFCPDDDDSRAT